VNHIIEVRKSSRSPAIGRQRLERLARRIVAAVLDAEGMIAAEVGIWFVNDPVIRRLNQRYRRINRATDVLAFALSDSRERRQPAVALGDVVVSVTTAHRQAKSLGHSLDAELALLLIHGVLHLLGYDHEQPSQARVMRGKERRLLAACGIPSIAPVLC
jgi:probable rRNA maturation factor